MSAKELLSLKDLFSSAQQVEQFSKMLVGFLISRFFPHEQSTAEDIASETMCKAWAIHEGHEITEPIRSVKAYLYRIAVNQAIRIQKRKVTLQELLQRIPLMEDIGEHASLPVKERELLVALQDAVLALPPKQREVIQLCYMEGLTREKMAEQLDCSPDTVKSRLRLAIEKLRNNRLLREIWEDE